ncbi:MAG TPA: GHMP kinase [Chloroflexota bacterium]|nr:GHMP kinase [Chloroflexota bacterium]
MIIAQTPLRLSFLGGGTDFPSYYASPANAHGGAVVGVSLDKYIYVIVKERFDDKIYINYSQKEIVDTVDEIRHELVREAMRLTGVERGVEITTLADVPSEGSGLGSSSAVTVGLLQALWTYRGEIRTAEQLAAEACRIELEALGRPMGVQDAYFSALGGVRKFVFGPDDPHRIHWRTLDLPPERISQLSNSLLLFYTHRTRRSATILGPQLRNIPERMAVLDQLRELAHDGARCLERGDFDAFGRLLHDGWLLKTQMADGITDKGIDEIYEAAREAGALGGKLAGAGGGGFLLLYCPLGAQDEVRRRLNGTVRELPFRFERDGTKIIFNVRRDPYF